MSTRASLFSGIKLVRFALNITQRFFFFFSFCIFFIEPHFNFYGFWYLQIIRTLLTRNQTRMTNPNWIKILYSKPLVIRKWHQNRNCLFCHWTQTDSTKRHLIASTYRNMWLIQIGRTVEDRRWQISLQQTALPKIYMCLKRNSSQSHWNVLEQNQRWETFD